MMEYKEIVGGIAVCVGSIGYIPYVKNMLSGKTKPHAFSWLIWSTLTGIAFSIQFSEGAGPGSYATGITSILCFFIFLMALLKGERKFPLVDWGILIAAIVAIFLWQATDSPITSIFLVTGIDAFAYLPTIRKGFNKPFEETATLFALDVLKWGLSLLAINTFIISTWFYPAVLMGVNASLVGMLIIRRNILRT